MAKRESSDRRSDWVKFETVATLTTMTRLGLSLGILLIAGGSLPIPPAAAVVSAAELMLPIAATEIPPLGAADTFLPPFEQQLILDLSDRRVYLYVNDEQVAAYPVAVGREGWETPTGEFEVFQRVANPVWQHPFTQEIVYPGPDNPLGSHWLGFWTDGTNAIGFHGTPHEDLIGQAVSHGCVRMRNADIEQLFEQVDIGTTVIVRA